MARVNLDISKSLDITCRRGDSFSLTLTLKDSSGNAINLHGGNEATFYMLVTKANPAVVALATDGLEESADRLAEISVSITDASDTTSSDATGIVKFEASAADMKAVDSGRYKYDIQYVDTNAANNVDSANKATTILTGSFVINSDASNV